MKCGAGFHFMEPGTQRHLARHSSVLASNEAGTRFFPPQVSLKASTYYILASGGLTLYRNGYYFATQKGEQANADR
jgi:hypothetical protein